VTANSPILFSIWGTLGKEYHKTYQTLHYIQKPKDSVDVSEVILKTCSLIKSTSI